MVPATPAAATTPTATRGTPGRVHGERAATTVAPTASSTPNTAVKTAMVGTSWLASTVAATATTSPTAATTSTRPGYRGGGNIATRSTPAANRQRRPRPCTSVSSA